jgi:hypothetical protein
MRTATLFFLGYMLMAKPPDGSSTWFHHADTFTLSDPDGQTWLRVSVPVSGGQLARIVHHDWLTNGRLPR